jgi:hypothetical protein
MVKSDTNSPYGGKRQHVEKFRKLILRGKLLRLAFEGPAYVPFLGDGDIAVELYADRKVFGADLDPARVATAQTRITTADIRVADCDVWPFADVSERFAIADLDAYSNPYKCLVSFWGQAAKARQIVIFGTDGLRQTISRKKMTVRLPEGTTIEVFRNQQRQAAPPAVRRQFNFWWREFVRPFIAETVAPYRIVADSYYLRNTMLYWGVVARDG